MGTHIRMLWLVGVIALLGASVLAAPRGFSPGTTLGLDFENDGRFPSNTTSAELTVSIYGEATNGGTVDIYNPNEELVASVSLSAANNWTATITVSLSGVPGEYTFTGRSGRSDATTMSATATASIYCTVTSSAEANGIITPEGAQMVNAGSSIGFTAIPDTGFVVDTWKLDGADYQQGATSCTVPSVTADHNISVSFSRVFTVTGSAGDNGSISPAGAQVVNEGRYITFSATPDTGYAIDTWFLDGIDQETDNEVYILDSVSSDHTVTVSFTQAYTVTGLAGRRPASGGNCVNHFERLNYPFALLGRFPSFPEQSFIGQGC